MCGFWGIFQYDGQGIEPETLKDATAELYSRGPDDVGYLLVNLNSGKTVISRGGEASPFVSMTEGKETTDHNVHLAFGFRRLAILDLSPLAAQPMHTADKRYWIICNGEIYNYVELRSALRVNETSFISSSDIEVLLSAYASKSKEVFSQIIGMFALAILDLEQKSICLARDFFGIKPLYYTLLENGFAFASDIRALLKLSDQRQKINPARLHDYLRFGITNHTSDSLFSGIYQLPPAHFLDISLNERTALRPQRYWNLRSSALRSISFKEASEKIRDLFLRNVQLHMRSDVPIGAGLSGGIDSSAIVMAMRELGGKALDLYTFSYVANDQSKSEEVWIDLIAQKCNPIASKIHLSPQQLADGLDNLINAQGEPFGSACIFAQYYLYQVVREKGIKVVLDGQGADELFAGYPGMLNARLASLLLGKQWDEAVRFLAAASNRSGTSLWLTLFRTWSLIAPPFLQKIAWQLLGEDIRGDALNERWFAEHGVALSVLCSITGREVLREQLYYQIETNDLPMLLRIGDRNAMASSVENRVPFLTPELAEFALALPEDFLIAEDGMSKAVFRAAMRGIVPDEILKRRDKIGFASLDPTWLTILRPWIEGVLKCETAKSIPALNLAELQREWDVILHRRNGFDVSASRHFDSRIWRWLNVIRWAEHFHVSFDI